MAVHCEMTCRRESRCKSRPLFPVALGVALALLSAAPCVEGTAHASARVVLMAFVAKDSSIRDLKMAELRHLFTNATGIGLSDEQAIPFNQPVHSKDRVGFDQAVLRLKPEQVGRFWIDHKIRGLSGPPRSVDSLPLLLRLVARIKGAVGYARPEQVAGDVRVIRIDGKLPTDAGYSLQFSE